MVGGVTKLDGCEQKSICPGAADLFNGFRQAALSQEPGEMRQYLDSGCFYYC